MEPVPVAFFASESQYVDHLAPTLRHVPDASLWCADAVLEHAAARGVSAQPFDTAPEDAGAWLWVVASTKDARIVEARFPQVETVAVCHGTGHTYAPGLNGRGSHSTRLFLTPNEASVAPIQADNPHLRVVAVGSPFMDDWQPAVTAAVRRRPVVVLSWHWDNRQCPETRSAWSHYRAAVEHLASRQDALPYDILGHGHPRAWAQLAPWYESIGIRTERDWHRVLELGDLYVCDNSSTMYQWAALDRPVLTLNAPWYNRAADYGLRFWEGIPGLQCDNPDDLAAAITAAISDPPEAQALRTGGVAAAFGALDGRAGVRAAEAITAEAHLVAAERDPSPVALAGRLGTIEVTRNTWDLIRDGLLVSTPDGDLAYVTRAQYDRELRPRGWREVHPDA